MSKGCPCFYVQAPSACAFVAQEKRLEQGLSWGRIAWILWISCCRIKKGHMHPQVMPLQCCSLVLNLQWTCDRVKRKDMLKQPPVAGWKFGLIVGMNLPAKMKLVEFILIQPESALEKGSASVEGTSWQSGFGTCTVLYTCTYMIQIHTVYQCNAYLCIYLYI